jgi:hypothetical protein
MSEEHLLESARRIFLRWERLRIWYNLILTCLVVGVTLASRQETTDWYLLTGRCIIGAVVANLLYIAGPIAESYLQWLGVRSRAITPIIFVSGLLAAMVLAAISVLSVLQPSEF